MLATKPKVRLKDRRRRESLVMWAVYTSAAVLALGGLAFVVRLPGINVSTIAVSGISEVPTADIQKTAESALQGSYAWLVPRHMALTAPVHAVASAVMATYPEIAHADANLSDMHTMTVVVSERVPVGVWCNATNVCYRIDSTGFIYKRADGSEPARHYTGLIDGEPIGQTLFPSRFTVLTAFITDLESELGEKVTAVNVTADGDIFVTLQTGGEVRFLSVDMSANFASTIAAVFDSPNFRRSALDYADFRFGQKAIVKFKK